MIAAKITGATLMLNVAAMPMGEPDSANVRHMSLQQKNAAVQTLVYTATDCIARTVAANPAFRRHTPDLGDLIVASVPSCVGPVRAMIDAYDRLFGDGTGEAFFMGPYLDALPAAVSTSADRSD